MRSRRSRSSKGRSRDAEPAGCGPGSTLARRSGADGCVGTSGPWRGNAAWPTLALDGRSTVGRPEAERRLHPQCAGRFEEPRRLPRRRGRRRRSGPVRVRIECGRAHCRRTGRRGGDRLVRPRRVPGQPTADQPLQSQPRADRGRPPVRPVAPRGRVRGGAGRAQPSRDPDQPRWRQDVAHGGRPPARRRQPPDGRLGPRATSGQGAPLLHGDGRARAQLSLRRQLQQQRGPDLAPGLHRQPHARLAHRDGGPGRRHEPGQPQLRHRLPRVQLAQGPDEGRRPPRGRVGRLRPHVRGDRDSEAPRARRLPRRVAHRLQARDRPGRIGVRGGLPARHEDVARVLARSPRAATRTSDGSRSGWPACDSTARLAV